MLASQEYQTNLIKDVFSDFTISDLMTGEVSTVSEDMSVQDLLEKMMKEKHSGYPVVDKAGNLIGCVTMGDIKTGSPEDHRQQKVGEIISGEVITVNPGDDLFQAFKKLSSKDIGRLMVVEEGNLIGIITRSDIMKAYRLKEMKQKSS